MFSHWCHKTRLIYADNKSLMRRLLHYVVPLKWSSEISLLSNHCALIKLRLFDNCDNCFITITKWALTFSILMQWRLRPVSSCTTGHFRQTLWRSRIAEKRADVGIRILDQTSCVFDTSKQWSFPTVIIKCFNVNRYTYRGKNSLKKRLCSKKIIY